MQNPFTLTEAVADKTYAKLASEAWTRACLERIADLEPSVESFAWLDPRRALARAREIDRASPAPLRGAPIGVKDIIDTRDVPTRMGSPAYADNVPSRSAVVVERLEAAGALMLGKTVTSELAFYVPGKTRNPWNSSHTPGGSSSGSAAAVAAGFIPAAIGTQTNGSVIRPAAYCGCIGFKPSFGRAPRTGVLRFSRALDQVGFFAREVDDVALLYSVCAGPDAGDPDCIAGPRPPGSIASRGRPPRLIAVRTPVWNKAETYAREHYAGVIGNLRAAGAAIEERELPAAFESGHALQRTIMYGEGARSYAPLKRDHAPLLSGMIHSLIDEGLAIDDGRLREALSVRLQLVERLREFLADADAIVTLPAAGEAPATLTSTGDPSFCTLWTLCGVPAITIPTGRGPNKLPLGTQLVGAPLADDGLLETTKWVAGVLGDWK